MTQTNDENQPAVEQSLHSLALSMIQINDELKKTRRLQHEALRFAKREAVIINRRPMELPKEPSLWAKIWGYSWGTWA